MAANGHLWPLMAAGCLIWQVILKLQSEKTLHASATYVQGGKKTALTFVSAGPKAPPLRSVTDLSEVPH